MSTEPDQPTPETLLDTLHSLLIADQAEDDPARALHTASLEAAYPGSTNRIADHLCRWRFTTQEALVWAQDPHDDALAVLTGSPPHDH